MVGIGYTVLFNELDERQDLLVKHKLVVAEPINNCPLTVYPLQRVKEDLQHLLLHTILQHYKHL